MDYIDSKGIKHLWDRIGENFSSKSHNHTWSQISDRPNSLPASDVHAWAKAASKPSYSWNEITNRPGIPTVYNSTQCTTYTTDSGACTPAAVKKAFTIFDPKAHTHNYLPLTGGVLSGGLAFNGGHEISWAYNGDHGKISFKTAKNDDPDAYMYFETADDGNEYFKFRHRPYNQSPIDWATIKSDGIRFKGTKVSLEGHTHTWSQIGDRPSSLPANGGNADSVDGQHFNYSNADNNPTYFWGTNSNGGSILARRDSTSVYYSNISGSVQNRGNLTAVSGRTYPLNGMSLTSIYNNGYPCSYGNLFRVAGIGAGELAMEWTGGDWAGRLFYRSLRDCTNNWSAWKTIAYTTDIPSIPSSLPASDVYGWAKAASKPSYSWGEISGRPGSLPANGGTSTNSASSNALNITGFGNSNLTFNQTASAFGNMGDGWAHYIICNHGDGSNYYNYILRLPFWSAPQYSRREGGTYKGLWTFWTTENFDPNTKVNTNDSRLTNARPASDVYGWAKAASKPSYSWGEISGRPGSLPANGGTSTCVTINYNNHSNSNYQMLWGSGNYVYGSSHIICNPYTGTITASEVTATSDRRLKSDIKDLKDRGPLKPKTYIKDGKESIGFIAQEVQELYPELVTGKETDTEYLSLNYAQLTAVLAAQVNDLKKENEILKKEIENIKNILTK